jgi:hypothetical protein
MAVFKMAASILSALAGGLDVVKGFLSLLDKIPNLDIAGMLAGLNPLNKLTLPSLKDLMDKVKAMLPKIPKIPSIFKDLEKTLANIKSFANSFEIDVAANLDAVKGFMTQDLGLALSNKLNDMVSQAKSAVASAVSKLTQFSLPQLGAINSAFGASSGGCLFGLLSGDMGSLFGGIIGDEIGGSMPQALALMGRCPITSPLNKSSGKSNGSGLNSYRMSSPSKYNITKNGVC